MARREPPRKGLEALRDLAVSMGPAADTPPPTTPAPAEQARPATPPTPPAPSVPARPAAATPAKPAPRGPVVERAVVRYERAGHGGKEVTAVVMEMPQSVLEQWARELKKALGCGGKVLLGEIHLQGDQRERLGKLLTDRGVRKISGL